MVVGEDDGGSPVGERAGEDFSGMGESPVHKADGDNADIDDFIGAIDGGAQKVFLFSIGVVSYVRDQIGWTRYFYAFRFDASSDELDCGEDEGGLGVTYAVEFEQILGLDIEAFFIDDRRQPFGERHYVRARYASPKEYRQ